MKYFFSRVVLRFKRDGLLKLIVFLINFFFKNEKKINLDNLKIPSIKKLDEYFLIFGPDKGYLEEKKTYYKI